MEIYPEFPRDLQGLQLEYISLPDLIEYGVPLSRELLRNIVRNTLGDQFLHDDGLSIDETFESGLSDRDMEGLIALLLLGCLNMNLRFSEELSFNRFLHYLVDQSLAFKRAVYPHLFELLYEFPPDLYHDVVEVLVKLESLLPADISGLDILYDHIGDTIMDYISPTNLIPGNIPFLLNHIAKIAIGPPAIIKSIQTGNEVLTRTLVEHFISPDNGPLLRQQCVDVDGNELNDIATELYAKMPDLDHLVDEPNLSWLLQSNLVIW